MDCTSALRFIEDRLGPNQIDKIIETATTAIAHEEATAMGLVCISILGGETFGNVSREEVQALFPHPVRPRYPAYDYFLIISVYSRREGYQFQSERSVAGLA